MEQNWLRKMTGLDAIVVLDPTLMLAADKWLEITEDFVPDDEKYVLTYFLGCPTEKQEHDIQLYAKTYGCRVRRILDLRDKEHMQLVRRILWSCFLKLNMYLRTHTMHVAFQSFFINSSRYLTALV